jgi:hypothetical protein
MRRLLCISLALTLLVGASPGRPAEARVWRMELQEKDGTDLSVRMTLRVEGQRWELYSRSGGVNALISWRQRLLGRLTGKLPPRGALLYASGSATSEGDSLVLRGDIQSPFSRPRVVRGSLRGDRFRSELAWKSDTAIAAGRLEGAPWTSSSAFRDYPAIAARTRDTIRGLIYDPAIGSRPNMVKFFSRLSNAAGRAGDDLDMMAGFLAAQPLIGISHFGFVRNPRIASTPLDSLVAGDKSLNPPDLFHLGFFGNGAVAYLRVQRWERMTPLVQRAFERIDSARSEVVVLDLTGNGGGDASAFSPAMHLFRDTVRAGYALGRGWYDRHREPPSRAEMETFPVIGDEERAKLLLKIVATEGAARAKFAPRAPYFAGKVYLQVDGRTGSASEFLVNILKSTGRATLYGKRTPGALLTALPHPVGDDFIVTVPEADYFTEAGTRIEGNGILPDVVVDDPHVAVAQEIRKTMPYAGITMLGSISFNRRKYDDAEKYWTEGRALATTDADRQMIDRWIAQARRAKQPIK